MKTKIVTFGEIMIRLSKPGYQRLFQGRNFEGNYGGSEANAAVSLAFMGDNVEYVTRVPYGPLGDAALMHLREYNLNVSHVVKGGDRLGSYYFEEAVAMRNSRVVYDRKGSSFYTLKRGMIKWDKVLEDAGIFHCSGITCAISRDAMETILPPESVKRLFEAGIVEVAPLAYMRGRTLDNAFIILDEAQNTTNEQMKMFLTRLGFNSKIVITGDITQIDLPDNRKSGLIQAMHILKDVDDIKINRFSDKDVVRHKLVQDIILAYEKYSKRNVKNNGQG